MASSAPTAFANLSASLVRLKQSLGLSSFNTLHWALAVSVGLHAVVLSVRFVAPQTFNRVFQDSPLEVVLVNARSHERPDKAQAIAQASLAGGGEAEKGRATSPLPPTAHFQAGQSAHDEEEQRVEALKAQQALLLAQIKSKLASFTPPQPLPPTLNAEQAEREQKRQQLVKLLAEIEKRVNKENARPRKRYISPATREEVYAIYYDSLRRKIEDHGTTHFPESGGKKLYGELTMVITINSDGRVLHTEVADGSDKPALDRRAQAIVRALSVGPFNEAMRRRADQIVVVSRFRFTRDETLSKRLFREGREALTRNELELACKLFRQSYDQEKALGPLLNLAICEQNRGKLVAARALWLESRSLSAEGSDARKLASDRLAALEKDIPRLKVTLGPGAPADTGVELDAAVVTLGPEPLLIDPGAHVIVARHGAREDRRELHGRVEIADAYLGGERSGGKTGRGSENKVPIVAAGEATGKGHPILASTRMDDRKWRH